MGGKKSKINFDGFGQKFLLSLLQVYQRMISPWLSPGCCRYFPNCSSYAASCLKRYNLGIAVWLILKRLSRCHPLGSSGFDPVPEVKESHEQ